MQNFLAEACCKKNSIIAKHYYGHRDGTFYNVPLGYPCILCDPYGYVRFEDEFELRECPRISVGQRVNVNGHISQLPGYTKFSKPCE